MDNNTDSLVTKDIQYALNLTGIKNPIEQEILVLIGSNSRIKLDDINNVEDLNTKLRTLLSTDSAFKARVAELHQRHK
jgi:hypothetical protein